MNENFTVSDYLQFWLENVVKPSVRLSTYTSYRGYADNHICRYLGCIQIDRLTVIDVQGLITSLLGEGRLSSRTVCFVVGMLSNALNCAIDYELIEKNVCKRVKLPRIVEEEIRAFNNLEQTKIEKAIWKQDDNRYFGILISLYTGLRLGEVCALRWEDIDFTNKCLSVKLSLNRTLSNSSYQKTVMSLQELKTRSSKRVILLPQFLVELLKHLRAISISEYIISMKNGKYVHPRTMQLLYKKLLEKAKVRYVNFHGLRHTFATRAIEINTDPKTVSDTLGHATTQITLNRYTHSLKEQKQKMMKGLDIYFKSKKIIKT